jgi:hypothetical protein
LFFGGDLPAEAAGSAKALSFRQIGLTPAPCIFCPLPIEGENGRDADCSKAYEISADRIACVPIVLQYEAQNGQAGTGQRDKNDATPPEKIGSHQHNNDVENGNRDVQRGKSVNYKDYDRGSAPAMKGEAGQLLSAAVGEVRFVIAEPLSPALR